MVGRPAEKHKFRFEYTPIKYDAETVLSRTIIFNGISFPVSIPIQSEVIWRAYRFTYEWDFVYRDRGFVGLILEAKYTDVSATLTNVFDTEFVRARAPIPAIGVIGRGYVAPNISITSEFSFFKVPDIDEDYGGSYFDFDIYGTVNFNDYVGAQGGYRSFDVFYKVEQDTGDMQVRGPVLWRGRTVLKGQSTRTGFAHTPRNRSSLLPGVDSDGRNPEVAVAVTSAARWPGATGTWTRRSSPGASVSSSRH